jgi:hypothetical protein
MDIIVGTSRIFTIFHNNLHMVSTGSQIYSNSNYTIKI